MLIKLYEKNNNPKDLARIVEVLEEGGIVIYPTDTMYAIGCHALKERAIERICRFKGIDPRKAGSGNIGSTTWLSSIEKA